MRPYSQDSVQCASPRRRCGTFKFRSGSGPTFWFSGIPMPAIASADRSSIAILNNNRQTRRQNRRRVEVDTRGSFRALRTPRDERSHGSSKARTGERLECLPARYAFLIDLFEDRGESLRPLRRTACPPTSCCPPTLQLTHFSTPAACRSFYSPSPLARAPFRSPSSWPSFRPPLGGVGLRTLFLPGLVVLAWPVPQVGCSFSALAEASGPSHSWLRDHLSAAARAI